MQGSAHVLFSAQESQKCAYQLVTKIDKKQTFANNFYT